MANKDQRTEQPTQRRMFKAREEGNFPTARIFVGSMQFLTFVALMRSSGGDWIRLIRGSMATLLSHALNPRLSASEVITLNLDLVKQTLIPLASLGGILLAVTLGV